MELGQRLLADLFIMFLAARIGGWLLARFRQPAVLGELLAGALIGPHTLARVGRPGTTIVWSPAVKVKLAPSEEHQRGGGSA